LGKDRLEPFSDGVIAILITIMVLELKVLHGETLESLVPLVPVFLSYLLSVPWWRSWSAMRWLATMAFTMK
jgi:uncharacterized membrane protein